MQTSQERFFHEQLNRWALAARHYEQLTHVVTRTIVVGDVPVVVQYNPGRSASTRADVSQAAIQTRPCFLCDANRPPEQGTLLLDATSRFKLLVNPFPVLPRHYTLIGDHQVQTLRPYLMDFLVLTRQLNDCVVFYNGPRCGASAPDHLHFQAGSKGVLPLPSTIETWLPAHTQPVHQDNTLSVSRLTGLMRSGWLLIGADIDAIRAWLNRLLDVLNDSLTEDPMVFIEPMVNVAGWFDNERWHVLLFPRRAHRPACYSATDHTQRLISPATVEMCGLLVVTREEDLQALTAEEVATLYQDVAWSDDAVAALTPRLTEAKEPTIDVGIVSGRSIDVAFPTPFTLIGEPVHNDTNTLTLTIQTIAGHHMLVHQPDGILMDDKLYRRLRFDPTGSSAVFEIDQVRIGIGFHWERTEKQVFEGSLLMLWDERQVTAVNRVYLETYLTSVISSEMSANASESLLKAHAVISRSWLLAQLRQKGATSHAAQEMVDDPTTRIRWYDREDHDRFDVCADDHCQRYQGLTRATNPTVGRAIRATRGQVLINEVQICDARFSKCCGGYLEAFEHCWENTPKPYLVGKPDWIVAPAHPVPSSMVLSPSGDPLDLSQESAARAWILGNPPAFCHTDDPAILTQVLNHYDQETPDFFRWIIDYTTKDLSDLVRRRSGIDFGTILDLIPVERGCSGRLVKLRIVGTQQSRIIGKELEIRKTLSESHLYSSAFVVEKTETGFRLYGAGWGHGVGLCQIGAAVMGHQGYDYQHILAHYYPNTSLETLYH